MLKRPFNPHLLLLIILLICIPGVNKGQSNAVDSLWNVIKNSSNDSVMARTYLELASHFKEISVDTAFHYFAQAAQHLDTTTATLPSVEYHYYLAELYFNTGDLPKVIHHLDFILQNGTGGHLVINRENVMIKKSQAYIRSGSFDKASELLFEALPLLEEKNDKVGLASAYGSLGTIMQYNNRLKEAIEYYRKTYEYYLETDNGHNAHGYLANLANIYSKQKQYDQSVPAFKKIIAYCTGKNEAHLLGLAHGNLGLNYVELDQQDSAQYHLLQSLDIYKSLNNKMRIARTSSQLSKLYINQEKFTEAVALLEPLYEFVQERGDLKLLESLSRNLGNAYKGLGKFEMALDYKEDYIDIQDSILNNEITQAVNDAEVKYESEKKQSEIERLALEDQLNQVQISRQRLTLFITFTGLGILSFLLYRLFSQKRKIESQNHLISKALREKDTLLREIHHRVKNNLQVISSLLGIQTRNLQDPVAIDALQESKARVQSMSLIHQNLYQKEDLTGIQIGDYLEKLSANILQTYGLTDQIEIQIEADNLLLDVDTVIPLGLVINELITNSIKYAFSNHTGKIDVKVFEENDELQVMVKDNGQGMTQPNLIYEGQGYGYELIQALITKLDGQFSVSNEGGTTVQASIRKYNKI